MTVTPEQNYEQKLKSELLNKLLSLQVELAAMRSVLQVSRIRESQTNLPIDWEIAVAAHRDAINSSFPVELYSELEQQLMPSTCSVSELLRLLIAMLDRPIST